MSLQGDHMNALILYGISPNTCWHKLQKTNFILWELWLRVSTVNIYCTNSSRFTLQLNSQENWLESPIDNFQSSAYSIYRTSMNDKWLQYRASIGGWKTNYFHVALIAMWCSRHIFTWHFHGLAQIFRPKVWCTVYWL